MAGGHLSLAASLNPAAAASAAAGPCVLLPISAVPLLHTFDRLESLSFHSGGRHIVN